MKPVYIVLVFGFLTSCAPTTTDEGNLAFFCFENGENSCVADGCVWDPTAKCVSVTHPFCYQIGGADACGKIQNDGSSRCIWDKVGNKCLDRLTPFCGEAKEAATCLAINRNYCIWENGECMLQQVKTRCDDFPTQKNCVRNKECTWLNNKCNNR